MMIIIIYLQILKVNSILNTFFFRYYSGLYLYDNTVIEYLFYTSVLIFRKFIFLKVNIK